MNNLAHYDEKIHTFSDVKLAINTTKLGAISRYNLLRLSSKNEMFFLRLNGKIN